MGMGSECETEYRSRFHFAGDIARGRFRSGWDEGNCLISILMVPVFYTLALVLSPLSLKKDPATGRYMPLCEL